jgi:uncharacterized membrane protein YhhN
MLRYGRLVARLQLVLVLLVVKNLHEEEPDQLRDALGVAIYAYLRPGLGTLRLPVLAYVAAIVTMVWTAVTAWTTHGGPGAAAAAAGALFFLASDTSLGIARFRHRYPGAQAVTLGTYYLGQWLIALSAGPLAAVR